MRRVVVPELLDNELGTPKEINDSLADLRWLNHHFGGIETTADLLRRIAAKARLSHISYLDVGGATGLLSIEVARRHPHVRCTSFDLPAVEPVAKKAIAASGLADRVKTA